jgi:hypothetical protein
MNEAPAPKAAAPAAPQTAIQILEQELLSYQTQLDQVIANTHAVRGAIQSTQNLLMRLRAEEQKAKALAANAEPQPPAELTGDQN